MSENIYIWFNFKIEFKNALQNRAKRSNFIGMLSPKSKTYADQTFQNIDEKHSQHEQTYRKKNNLTCSHIVERIISAAN